MQIDEQLNTYLSSPLDDTELDSKRTNPTCFQSKLNTETKRKFGQLTIQQTTSMTASQKKNDNRQSKKSQ